MSMDINTGMQKMSIDQLTGKAVTCLGCRGICKAFEPHLWRKICQLCKCSQEDHSLCSDTEDDRKIGRLLADSKYSNLTARLKGGDGGRIYKRNRMIITNPIVTRKDPTFHTVTYEWAPPGVTQKLAIHYMEFIPKETQPISGTEGAYNRRRQLTRQLPVHDQDPSQCHALSETEVKQMEEFIRKYKSDVLGVGEVALPGQAGATAKQEATRRLTPTPTLANGKAGGRDKPAEAPTPPNGMPTADLSQTQDYSCEQCKQAVGVDTPAVYGERIGYEKLWHPACFICSRCGQPLVDLIYFWKNNSLLCGRHYCESERPRCAACDELIFSDDSMQSDGLNWHKKHFCCVECEQPLVGKSYILEQEKLQCVSCNKSTKSI